MSLSKERMAVVLVVLLASALATEIFAMLVLMALVTTAMTGPLLSLSLTCGRARGLAPAGPVARQS